MKCGEGSHDCVGFLLRAGYSPKQYEEFMQFLDFEYEPYNWSILNGMYCFTDGTFITC